MQIKELYMKLNSNAQKLVKGHCDSLYRAMDASGSSGRWPMPVLRTTIDACIFSEPVVAEVFYKHVKKLQKKYKNLSAISKQLEYPSGLARLSMISRSRSLWSLDKNQQIDMYNILGDLLAPLYQQDHFCLKGRNILLDLKKQQKTISRFKKADKFIIDNSTIAQLDGRLWLYTEMIYTRWHNLAHEFHGPYGNKEEKLLIKDWHDLQGPGWAAFKNFPYKKIICYEFYKNNRIFIDMHNRLSSKKPLAQTFTRTYLEIDGKLVSSDQALGLIKILDKYIAQGSVYLARQNKKQLKKINAIMEFYAIKPLADILGENWRPPNKLFKAIDTNKLPKGAKELLAKLTYYYPKMDNMDIINLQFNPSLDFVKKID